MVEAPANVVGVVFASFHAAAWAADRAVAERVAKIFARAEQRMLDIGPNDARRLD
jgi:hypothetical protein